MLYPRLSLAQVLALMAVVGADCALVRHFATAWDGYTGWHATAIVLSVAICGIRSPRDRLRRFALVFVISALIASVVLHGSIRIGHRFAPETTGRLFMGYLRFFTEPLPTGWEDWVPVVGDSHLKRGGLRQNSVHEILLSLPPLAVALVGGVLALTFRRWSQPRPAHATPSL